MIPAAAPMSSSPNFQNNSSASGTMKSSTKFGQSLDTFVLLSLLFQFILMITAPSRKHLERMFVLPVVWLVYLLQFTVSNYAMGLIPNDTFQGGRTGNLRIFWAPFLILHLGGPNTLSSLGMEDNELWLRFAIHLFSLSYTFGRVFLRSFLKKDLWVPTAILFLAAALRYMEKVICQFLARLNKFRESTLPKPDPGVNYAKLVHIHSSFLESKLPEEFQIPSSQLAVLRPPEDDDVGVIGPKKKLSQVVIVKQAYRFFHDFRGLFANSIYSYDLREHSRRYFLSIDAEDAFGICETELNFAYDVFFTKSILIDKPFLQWLNLASLFLQLLSTVLWIRIDKTSFNPDSVRVTNALVYGSISLDLFSYFMLAVSDWGIALVNRSKVNCCFEVWLLLKKCARETQRRMWELCFVFKRLSVFFRWSENVPQLDLITICICQKSMATIVKKTRNKNLWISTRYFTDDLRNFIFNELVIRSVRAKQPRDVEELCSSRGMWIIGELSREEKVVPDLATTLGPWISDVDYEESLILWNIATTLCYCTCDGGEGKGPDLREFSKVLADYMLHLLNQTMMMPPLEKIHGLQILVDTCADTKRFLDRKLPQDSKMKKKKLLQQACEEILQVNTDVIPPRQIKGDESKSVLFDGCLLAKRLQRLEVETKISKWEIISKVWAEMLFYCATRSPASNHLEKLAWGGELLTIVWLLMAHLGLGKHFRYNKDTTTAELVIGKRTA